MINLLTGIVAAMAHVLAGPDHLAAVTPLAIESKKKSWRIGMAWGIGHTLGILIIGLLFLLFREVIPVEKISEHSEQIVGVMLILIGVWAIWKAYKSKKHAHPHVHKSVKGEYMHIHEHHHQSGHEHTTPEAHIHEHQKQHKQNIRTSLGIGIFHGLAGVSHLFTILPTLALPSRFDAAMYLSGFGIGTVGAMILFSAILGFISLKTSGGGKTNAFRILRILGGIVAVIVGVWWIVSTF
jgi:ABC-type nickel/cobalt efflux system permease component RcnA